MIQAASLFAFLFSAFYFLFSIFYDPIHNFYSPVDQNSIIFWQWSFLAKEGIELPVMLAGIILYLFVIFLFINTNLKKLRIFESKIFQLFSIGITLFILAGIKSYIFSYFDEVWKNIVFLVIAIIIVILSLLFLKFVYKRKYLKVIVFLGIWTIFVCVVILSLPAPNVYDYGFFLGPALKISQGEKLGSFFMQYGLGLTYIFKLMMDLKMKISQMQIFLAFSTMLWFGLYYILSRRLIANKYLLLLFMMSLVVLRYLAVFGDPTFIPAVSPLRLDLWVLLALCVFRFGFQSVITSGLAAALYIFDDTFGLFYLMIYVMFLVVLSLKNFNPKKLLLFILPIIALAWHFITFGSFTSLGARLYQGIQLGFIPITLNSPFWIILAALPYFLWILLQEENKKLKTFFIFLLTIAVAQLVYFFGRSNDNNLIHLSGIFVLLLFIFLEKIAKKYKMIKTAALSASVFVVLISLLFAGDISDKFLRAYDSLIHFRLGNIAPVEEYVNQNPNLLANYKKDKLMILSGIDSYYNYRYGIKQLGYYVPFSIHLYADETTKYLMDKINHGYNVAAFWEGEITRLIEQLNDSKKMKSLGMQFEIKDKGYLFEVGLAKSVFPITRTYLFKNIRFSYPQTWRLKKISENKVEIREFLRYLNMTFEVLDNVNNFSAPDYIDLKDSSPFKIAGAEKILGKLVQENGANKFELLVFKGNKEVNIEIYPADIELMRTFLPIINSIEFKEL